MKTLATHTELRQMIKEVFADYTKKVEDTEKKLMLDLGQCSIIVDWKDELNMYHVFISENEFVKINSSFRNLLQENIDNIVRSWNPFQEYESNPVEINTSSYINYLLKSKAI